MGRSGHHHVSRLEGQRAAAERPGHCGAGDDRHHGAVRAARMRTQLRARPAHPDRGQETRLRRPAALRGRPARRRGAGRHAVLEGIRGRARGADRAGAGRPVPCSGRTRRNRQRYHLPGRRGSRRQHGVADPEQFRQHRLRRRPGGRGRGFALQNRGALFTLEATHPNVLAERKRPLHTILPAFMQAGQRRIAFGIMGGWNQARRTHSSSPTWSTSG